jgi:hypothetical protein
MNSLSLNESQSSFKPAKASRFFGIAVSPLEIPTNDFFGLFADNGFQLQHRQDAVRRGE